MPFSKEFIYKKLEAITGYTKELSDFLELNTDEQIMSDSGKLHISERLVQLIVDNMIDINQHFIRELNLEIPDDLQGSFFILGENDILPKEFAFKIAPVTGVRNILVHQYEKLDKEMFIHNIRRNFSDFEKYAQYIVKYLEKNRK
ncbi:MAG: DUF86 domain-containing protein [Candidatus Paceibacteria bacterium]